MICQYGLSALLRGNMRKLLGCGRPFITAFSTGLMRSAMYPEKCIVRLQTLHLKDFREIVLKRRMSCVAGVWVGAPNSQRLPKGVVVVPHRSAGHSKWQNIKHIKEANDKTRSIAFSKLAVRIKQAVQAGKSSDPKLNQQLAHLMDEAKRINMPGSKIDSIIKAAEGSKDAALIPFTLEAKGPGGTFLIIELLTDNINRSRNNIKYQLSKVGVVFVDGIMHMFEYKGVVAVDPLPSNVNLETAIDLAIEAGAEDVVEATENDGTPVLQFVCSPREFFKVKSTLSDMGHSLKSSKLSYIPNKRVSLVDEHLELMSKVSDILDNHPDVDAFYDNVE